MGCNCGKFKFNEPRRPAIVTQPTYGVKLNTPSGSSTGAVVTNPNKPLPDAPVGTAVKRTQI